MRVWAREGTLKDLVQKDKSITAKLKDKDINEIFDLGKYLKNVDYIFKRAGLE